MMQLIPVVDLLNGMVVHAKKGDRNNYQPMQSALCKSSEPIDVVNALLELYPFERIYIADLDAITGQSNHIDSIKYIQAQHPTLEIWLDAGIRNASNLLLWRDLNLTHVIGSENIASTHDLSEISEYLNRNFILSLDSNQSGFLGCADLETNTDLWPENIILMSLAQVGANQGTNLELLEKFKHYSKEFNLYAAGGVRNIDDVSTLKPLGIYGALIASALHSKQISADEIKSVDQ
jgi:phosphoribosylformimino-5-aminoimidazole carboxamide ribotide isomerase